MQLIGMLDSPYVRRVAISAACLGYVFEHRSVSVFRHLETFRAINPLIKAPTLVLDDGGILLESSLILDYLEHQADPARRLMPDVLAARTRVLYLLGVALVACEKTVQHLYETQLRPADKQHEPWRARVAAQLDEAWQMLEPAAAAAAPWLLGRAMTQADITLAVAWRFNQHAQPGLTDAARFPALAALSARAEALPEFLAYPVDRE